MPVPFAYRLATAFGLPIIVGGLLWGVTNSIFGDIVAETSAQTSSSEMATGLSYATQAWEYAPLFLMLGLAAAVVSAALARRRFA